MYYTTTTASHRTSEVTTTENVLYQFSGLTLDYIDWVMGVYDSELTTMSYTLSKKNNNNKIL
jgi:hypothetical protein